MGWADDDTGSSATDGPRNYLTRYQDDGTGIIQSLLFQNIGDNGLTVMSSSFTVQGDLEAFGNVILGDNIADTVDVNGILKVDATLTVDGNTVIGNAVTDIHAINRAVDADVALSVDSDGTSGKFVAKFYSGGAIAAWIRTK